MNDEEKVDEKRVNLYDLDAEFPMHLESVSQEPDIHYLKALLKELLVLRPNGVGGRDYVILNPPAGWLEKHREELVRLLKEDVCECEVKEDVCECEVKEDVCECDRSIEEIIDEWDRTVNQPRIRKALAALMGEEP